MARKIVCLTEGHTNPHTAKTAASVIRYRPDEAVAVLDSTHRGGDLEALLGVGRGLPIIGSLAEAPAGSNTLLIGIAPPGGKIPAEWRAIVLEAIERGMEIVSGLHDFLSDDAEFVAAAERKHVRLFDVRKNSEKTIARRVGINPNCLRIHTVGHDCSIGKMCVALEVTNALRDRGYDAKFVATGQTGIMVEGDGLPIDCIVADFVAGAAEKLVLDNQQHQILLIEGQGSLTHPSYSGVTLGLLHGSQPQGLILCYEVGREKVTGIESMTIPPLATIKSLNEQMANVMHRCEVLGIGMNSRRVTRLGMEEERARREAEFQLPVCDVYRDGPGRLADAVSAYYESGRWR
ncbi:MAG TPA: DUF1611 domain-containing protein [Pirellulaceae bacterium]|nr:DUF1611 domain-containing protein [Pirellulaceae bacterium]